MHYCKKERKKTFLETLSTSETLKTFCSGGHLLEGLQQFSECRLRLPVHSDLDNRPGICFKQGGKPSSVYGHQMHTALPVCQCTQMKTNTHNSTMMTSVHGLRWPRFNYQALHLSSKRFLSFLQHTCKYLEPLAQCHWGQSFQMSFFGLFLSGESLTSNIKPTGIFATSRTMCARDMALKYLLWDWGLDWTELLRLPSGFSVDRLKLSLELIEVGVFFWELMVLELF